MARKLSKNQPAKKKQKNKLPKKWQAKTRQKKQIQFLKIKIKAKKTANKKRQKK
jgi:hypothetical protein